MRDTILPRDLNLLPASARQRVLHAQEMSTSCLGAFGLVVLAVLAAIGAELVRQDALTDCDRAERDAEAAVARAEHVRRLAAEVRELAGQAVAVQQSDADLPLLSLLGAVGRALPNGVRLDRFRVFAGAVGLEGEVRASGSDADCDRFVATLVHLPPFASVWPEPAVTKGASSPQFAARFAVAEAKAFELVYDDADVNAAVERAERADDLMENQQ